MIGSSPIGSAPIASYSGDGVIAGNEYAIAATTAAPSLLMLVNIEINITATTAAPAIAMTATLLNIFDIATTTSPPTVSIGIISEGLYSVATTTSKPSVSMTLTAGMAFSIAASTAAPSVVMAIVQNLVHAIAATTSAPSVLVTISGPALTIAAGETTAWSVNMTTGAHSRYTDYPDASGVSLINAVALTAVTDFGDSHEKYIHDIYIHCRLQDTPITIDTITDEWVERTGYGIDPCDSVQGITRRRRKLAKGIKGQNWQFRLNNSSGGSFTVKQLDAIVTKSQRRV